MNRMYYYFISCGVYLSSSFIRKIDQVKPKKKKEIKKKPLAQYIHHYKQNIISLFIIYTIETEFFHKIHASISSLLLNIKTSIKLKINKLHIIKSQFHLCWQFLSFVSHWGLCNKHKQKLIHDRHEKITTSEISVSVEK